MQNKNFDDIVDIMNKTWRDIEYQENKRYVVDQLLKDLKPKGIPLSKLNEHLRLKDSLKRLGLDKSL